MREMVNSKKNVIKKSEKLKQIIESAVQRVVERETKDCFRVYKARVVTAPDADTGICSVRLTGQSETLDLPYSSRCANVTVGSIVWVAKIYGSWRNGIVWEKQNFS